LDLLVANYNDSKVSVLFGRGDGTFGKAVNYPVGSNPQFIATADINGDGILDFVTANHYNTVSIVLGKGNGEIQRPLNLSIGNDPTCVALTDLNADGKIDLTVVNYLTGNSVISVLLGNGDGTFGPPADYPVGNSDYLVVADFNGDGIPDIAVNNILLDTILVLQGQGDGTFQPGLNYAVGSNPLAMTAGDFQGNGKQSLAVVAYGAGQITVLLNTTP
jgi:hypothetical protein